MNSLEHRQSNKISYSRYLTDKIVSFFLSVVGISIIAFSSLIFFYLLWVVWPIFTSSNVEHLKTFTFDSSIESSMIDKNHLSVSSKHIAKLNENDIQYLQVSDNFDIFSVFLKTGQVSFFNFDGDLLGEVSLPFEGDRIQSIQKIELLKDHYFVVSNENEVLIVSLRYDVNFDNSDKAIAIPYLDYPYLSEPIKIFSQEEISSSMYDLSIEEDLLFLTFVDNEANNFYYRSYYLEEDYIDLEVEEVFSLPQDMTKVDHIFFADNANLIYLITSSSIHIFDIRQQKFVFDDTWMHLIGHEFLQHTDMLVGDNSLLTTYENHSEIYQWFFLKDTLTLVRQFDMPNELAQWTKEPLRKGVVIADQDNNVHLFHSTSEKSVKKLYQLPFEPLSIYLSEHSNYLLFLHQGISIFHLNNDYPEISFSALWNAIWYETYDKPSHVWQSSSSNSDFEPKYGLLPLAFGTFKAAFSAMFIAVPIALFVALYTSFFMSKKLRAIVKPMIEMIAALPTVILGFLAALWLAPAIESNLLFLMMFPVIIFIFPLIGVVLEKLSVVNMNKNYQFFGTVIFVALTCFLLFHCAGLLETVLFDGDFKQYIWKHFGITYDQRNTLVVAIIMGFAVIPIIYSISEDAISGVPKHLIHSSLALGATPWQTLIQIVLLTASPGIFSAIMIGFGRAVGETMIVLMATGNTPVIDWSFFEGLRSFSANLAVELPESEIGSTHYRVLFLTALLLCFITFVLNSIAEVIRGRLRKYYSNL